MEVIAKNRKTPKRKIAIRSSMQIIVNGERREAPEGCTIVALLDELDIRAKHVAVERNREVVPRAEHGETTLSHGDELEVVTLVGGG